MKLLPGAAFIGAVLIVLAGLFAWRDRRVGRVLDNANRGDVVNVGSDVCFVLREREFIERDTDCGYRQTVEVRLIKDPG